MKSAVVNGLSWKGYEGQDYEHFWEGPAKQYVDELEHAIVVDALGGGGSIVEVGAGFGRLGTSYIGRYSEVHMVEPASNLRAAAENTFGKSAKYYEASVEDLPFASNSIDAVLMVRVFHHLGDPAAALREINRVMKPGGSLLFNYSNKRNVKRVAAFMLGRGENPFDERMEKYYEYLIGHHPRFVENLVRDSGFTISRQYAVGIGDKVVGRLPFLRFVRPSIRVSRLMGRFRIAPAQFILAVKR